mgnify:CR=1 FL=1
MKPLIAVIENDPVTFVAFALNCSTYMKEVYLKNGTLYLKILA